MHNDDGDAADAAATDDNGNGNYNFYCDDDDVDDGMTAMLVKSKRHKMIGIT
jgi:hypothetical protein